MIINGPSLLKLDPIVPMISEKRRHLGYSYGLTECGYDIRIKDSILLHPFRRFRLSSSFEYFNVPKHLMGRVLNKSSWARQGLDASMTTNIEPGWRGFLTLELHYAGWKPLRIPQGVGIAQVIFEEITHHAQYVGPYQDQRSGPVPAHQTNRKNL